MMSTPVVSFQLRNYFLKLYFFRKIKKANISENKAQMHNTI